MNSLTPAQKAKYEKEKHRRRRERRRREDEYRRLERLRRQIEDARRRRQRMLLLFLLAVLAMQESILATFQRSYTYQPDPDPEPSNWTPNSANDYAPRAGDDDHCDGYSREQWNRMLDKRGIRISRKGEIKAAWEADPERERFPERYQDWGYRPHLAELIYDLTAPYWQADAFAAIKLLTPHEVHTYLGEAYATDPGDLRQCHADRDHQIVAAFQNRAILWEERKQREAEEARKAKNDKKPDDDEKKFDA
ncbi:hypothetical protein U8C40_16275 [Sinorhizobium medicae]|nr:hypothetical protein U8C40_16275 [Sinorhizobium medicae]